MKKFVVIAISMFVLFTPISNAYSSGFLYMIEAMGIERINVNGFEINEEIYEKYNLMVYGDPISINHPKQRWKATEKGKWVNSNLLGEFWILGQDYSGRFVHNELFPDDYNSGTSPLEWNYRIVKDAEESWNDTSMYMYESQREYMLTQKLSRFGITYDLTVLDIGVDKAKVENYATWGNAGSIYTEKPGEGNVYWAATFNVPPMASSAELNSILEFPNGTEYTIEKDATSVAIPYIYGGEITGLTEYAKAEHIKIIETELKINNVRKEIISGKETLKVAQNGSLIINKNDYPGVDKIVLNFESNSFATTYFANDLVMYDSVSKTITINVENEVEEKVSIKNDENAPTIYDVTIKRVTTDVTGRSALEELYVNNRTRRKFVCAGQVINIEVKTSPNASAITFLFEGSSSITTLDDTTKKFLWDEPAKRNEYLIYSNLTLLERAYKFPAGLKLKKETESYKIFSGTYVIPYETTQTLHSWNSLRKDKGDAFKIDESKLFTSIKKPYKLVVRAHSYKGMSSGTYLFDVAERWDQLFNRDISEYISR